MAKGRSDISNFALRVFLQKVGHVYDTQRGFEPFKPTKNQWVTVTNFFGGRCCYCNAPLNQEEATEDHLIPLNKSASGLHAWGNVVLCCGKCNKMKHGKDWREYLITVCVDKIEYQNREIVIENFQTYYKYDPKIKIGPITRNLYEDVGAVAMTLIELRFKQAEQVIQEMLKLEEKD